MAEKLSYVSDCHHYKCGSTLYIYDKSLLNHNDSAGFLIVVTCSLQAETARRNNIVIPVLAAASAGKGKQTRERHAASLSLAVSQKRSSARAINTGSSAAYLKKALLSFGVAGRDSVSL